MESPRSDILPSHGKHHLDRMPGYLYRDSLSPEFADDERSPSPQTTGQAVQANSKSSISLIPPNIIIAKLIPHCLFLGNNGGPSRSGKSARLTICPAHRAPRTTTHKIAKAKRSATARAQQKKAAEQRKKQRHSPVPVQAEDTQPEGEAVDANKPYGAGLPLRPKLELERP